jgi:GT2 family glycosyltransferase
MNNPKVVIITLNWNGQKYLSGCLESLLKIDYQNFKIIVVENGSNDGSKEYLQNNFKDKIKIIDLPKNTGFAKGNNLGIQEAFKDPSVKYIATINNDAKVDTNWLKKMLEIIEKDKKIGMIAPKINFFYEPDLIDSAGIIIGADGGGMNRGFKEKDVGQYEKTEEVFGACAGAALYSREMLEAINLNDENYFDNDHFAYYEDLDLAWRGRLAGYKCIYTPKARVWHVHSATSISYSPFKAFHVQRNRLYTIIKNYPLGLMFKAFFILTPLRYIHLVNSVRIKKGPSAKLKEKTRGTEMIKIVIKAWWDFLVNIPNMLKKRKIVQKNIKKVDNIEIKSWFKKFPASLNVMIYK